MAGTSSRSDTVIILLTVAFPNQAIAVAVAFSGAIGRPSALSGTALSASVGLSTASGFVCKGRLLAGAGQNYHIVETAVAGQQEQRFDCTALYPDW